MNFGPTGTKPFVQMVDGKNGFMTSVLLQHHGDRLRPVAYFSSKLDPAAAGLPQCLKAMASAEKAVMASKEFVGYSDLTLMVPHAVSMILQEQKTSHLSTAPLLETILLPDKIAIRRCATLTNNKDSVSTRNVRADSAAKATSMETFALGAEKDQWKQSRCALTNGVGMSCDGKPCLPRHFFAHYAKTTHGPEGNDLESQEVAGAVKGASDHPYGCERKNHVDLCQPLQKSPIYTPGGGADDVKRFEAHVNKCQSPV
ncbi:hypothetical protein H4Q32_025036 [Labeo rohita]|uniref:Reverse transcriptase RNase H-like domain-containing protein n=1 Tax=Labeo rohita TaxID=84645 RepID=A0ABQ8LAG3_LABRO|nr:hypothetical protein H4Q32_025036 [Labeo rohita]